MDSRHTGYCYRPGKPVAPPILHLFNLNTETMDNMKHRRLQELNCSDFKIVEGDPDIRSWDVKLSSGQKVGEVDELVIDAQLKKVRYMVVALENHSDLNLPERKVLMPIGLAELDEKHDEVRLAHVQAEHLRQLPSYDADQLTAFTEETICRALGRDTRSRTEASSVETEPDASFYQHDYYNTDNLYKHRLHEIEQRRRMHTDGGLHLWELRSREGEAPQSHTMQQDARSSTDREKNPRHDRREKPAAEPRRKSGSIIDRIKNEGLQ